MHTTRHRTGWVGIVVGLLSFLLVSGLLVSGSAFAHPMGNFSVNHYGKIRVGQTSVEILYLVDMAEIPTYQEMRQFGITTKQDDPGDLRYLDGQETRLKEGLTLEIDDQTVDLATISRQVAFVDGAGGLGGRGWRTGASCRALIERLIRLRSASTESTLTFTCWPSATASDGSRMNLCVIAEMCTNPSW